MPGKSNFILRGGADFSDIDKKMKALEKDMKKRGKSLQSAGKALTIGVTVPVMAMGTAAVSASIQYESAFAGVRKTVDATEAEFGKLSDGIRDMSKQLPLSAAEIATIAEAAGQLGIKTDSILGFTRVMADLGVATNLTSDQAASSLAQFANITQMPQGDFEKLGSTIVSLGNNMATTEADIVEMGMRLAGAGKQVGLSEAEIMSFSAALSSVGIEAEAGGSAFSKVMVEMQLAAETGGSNLKNFASVAGMSSDEFATAFKKDAASALNAFIKGLGKSEEKGISAIKVLDDMGISEVRMRDTLLRAAGAGDLFTESLELGTKAWEENTALSKEAAQRYKTTESKLKILKNKMTDVAITLGDGIVPALIDAIDAAEPLIKSLSDMAKWFADLKPETQKAIVKMLLFSAALGPILTGLGKIIQTKAAVKIAFSTIGTSAAAAGGAGGIGKFVASCGVLLGPGGLLALLIVGFGGLAAMIALSKDNYVKFADVVQPQGSRLSMENNGTAGVTYNPDKQGITGNPFFQNSLPLLPAMASGGIVKRPTIAMIGEAGPEAVIPLGKMGQTVNHTGTIRVEGVNNRGELVAVVEQAISSKIMSDNRRMPARTSLVALG